MVNSNLCSPFNGNCVFDNIFSRSSYNFVTDILCIWGLLLVFLVFYFYVLQSWSYLCVAF